MDKLFLHGIKLKTSIGCLDWEKQLKQNVIIDLVLTTELQQAATSDDINQTIDYAKILAQLQQDLNKQHFQLIEALAEYLVQRILANHSAITTVKITLTKPEVLPNCKAAGVTLVRHQK